MSLLFFMNSHEGLIQIFYRAFQDKDFKTMQSCYSESATFNDPVFKNLNSSQVKAMWEMLIKSGKDLSVEYKNIQANEHAGSAEWIATYTFSQTGRKVTNHVYSQFTFENNKIKTHHDDFDFTKWSKQALGFSGILLGRSSFLKQKVSDTAMKKLFLFMNK